MRVFSSTAPGGASSYRARYYDQATGRFLNEDPVGFNTGVNFYRYVRNGPVDLKDPRGLYGLEGFSPADAAQMTIAIGNLWAKLKSNPCCVGRGKGDELLGLLQPGNYGAGVTFVHRDTITHNGRSVDAGVELPLGYYGNKVLIADKALNGFSKCPLEGIILHELVHLTPENHGLEHGKPREDDAYGKSIACYGEGCKEAPKP